MGQVLRCAQPLPGILDHPHHRRHDAHGNLNGGGVLSRSKPPGLLHGENAAAPPGPILMTHQKGAEYVRSAHDLLVLEDPQLRLHLVVPAP